MPQDKVRVAFVGRLKNAALVEFIAERGWSQARLARELSTDQVTVGRWVLLKASPKDEVMLKKIERLLGQLREDIFPDFFQSKEWKEMQKKLPKEHVVVREVPVQQLLQSGRLALPSPEVEYDKKELREQTERVLGELSQKESHVLNLYFGLGDAGEEHTYGEIANMLGVSIQRARQIALTALGKLRRWEYYSNRLRPFLDDA